MLSDKTIVRAGKPDLYDRIKQKIRAKLSVKGRQRLNMEYAQKVKEKDFTVITSNCIGGVLYHDFGMPFLSPTINMAFDGEDFCKFCERIPYYLAQEMTEVKTDLLPHPVAKLDDVEILLVHYHVFDEAKQKWEERAKRVNYDKILLIATDRDGMADHMERFDKLPYRKIMYTAKPYPQYDWTVYCPCFAGKSCVGVMTGIVDLQGHRFYEKYVDIPQILNSL